MIKKLPTEDIVNELTGASAFFEPQSSPIPASQADVPSMETLTSPTIPDNQASNHDSVLSRNHAITHSSTQDSKQSSMQDSVMDDNLDEIRKAVKQLGKELSTHRFTAEEKAVLSDIVYTYARQDVRTSENEITRIGVNWLLIDYRQNGANSVLARMLERLHG